MSRKQKPRLHRKQQVSSQVTSAAALRGGDEMSNTGLYFDSESENENETRSRYNDSDEESLVDVDSPADGYFERREHPQTTYMPNPATRPRSEEDKAREAAAERSGTRQEEQARSPARERERPPSHGDQPRSPVWTANENTPLLDAGPAGPPPDYAAATADRRHGREGSYGSMSDSAFSSDHPLVRNGLLNEQGVFAQRSEPQSMRDTSTSPHGAGLRGGGGETEADADAAGEDQRAGDEERGFVRRRWDRDWNGRRPWMRHRKVKRTLTWLAVFTIVVIILLISGTLEDAQENGKYPSGGNGRNQPETPPARPSLPGNGNGESGDEKDPTEDSPMPPHRSTSSCTYRSFSPVENFTFASPEKFSFLEFIEDPTERGLFNDNIGGTLQISAAPPSQEEAIVMWISIAVSGPWKVKGIRRILNSDALQIMFPTVNGRVEHAVEGVGRAARWTGAEGSCMDISAGMLVRPGVSLEGLEISTANLNVRIERGVFDSNEAQSKRETKKPAFNDIGATSITAMRGRVHAAYLSSRTTYIETTSSRITGMYALRDGLSLKSTSGSIEISVDPKEATTEDPNHPADFHAASNSGSVDVGYLTAGIGRDKIPKRDYHTRVETSSSSIKGSYILGSTATFGSNSGTLDFSLLPYHSDVKSTLHTDSGSAQTKLHVLSPYTASDSAAATTGKDGVLGHLSSTHKSRSGALKLRYPDEWEGVVDGQSTSGSCKVRGKDVEILIDNDFGKGVPGGKSYHHVTARKGYGESRLNFATTSGSVDVLVGQV